MPGLQLQAPFQLKKAGSSGLKVINAKVSRGIFRHSMATLMLENGADIRFIQRMLGHSCLESMEVYTHVSVTQLKKVHELTHPAESKS